MKRPQLARAGGDRRQEFGKKLEFSRPYVNDLPLVLQLLRQRLVALSDVRDERPMITAMWGRSAQASITRFAQLAYLFVCGHIDSVLVLRHMARQDHRRSITGEQEPW